MLVPAASDSKFFPLNTYDTLSSCNVSISVSLANNFCIEPKDSSSGLKFNNPRLNSLSLFTLVSSLNTPL